MRFTIVAALSACLFLLTDRQGDAGAWTLKKHHWQTFNSTTLSMASQSYASDGHASTPTKFHKFLVQNTVEFGLTDSVTLFATPAYVVASAQTGSTPLTNARTSSVEAGARVLLFAHVGKLSFQSSYKAAGAFDLSDSANHDPARQIEVRLLYGTSFKVLGDDGFVDVQVAERWINHQRPNETPIDLTVGLWLRQNTMVMAQSFNTISGGDAIAPFTYYRSHKVGVSLVERISRHWSLQLGGYLSPAGQNALDEKGVSLVFWTQN